MTEYRDLLSLVTRTRERFTSIDKVVTAAYNARRGPDGPPQASDGGSIQRVVIAIDNLDRCPPDKVITVLEAVHLLFDFQMFVVLLAVDTRWLEQSLRSATGSCSARPTPQLQRTTWRRSSRSRYTSFP